MKSRTVTAFTWVPSFAQGLVRDLRVRWALEEAGFAYDVRLIGPDEQGSPDYLAQQPFGQVPVYQEEDLVLFESGAIVMHIARQSNALMPPDEAGRSRVASWMFAALNSLELQVQNLAIIDLFNADQQWARLRRPGAEDAAKQRLARVAAWLEQRDYLEQRFSAADILMVTVLRTLRHTDLVAQYPVLAAYQKRGEQRPAFQRALAAQLAVFADAPSEVDA